MLGNVQRKYKEVDCHSHGNGASKSRSPAELNSALKSFVVDEPRHMRFDIPVKSDTAFAESRIWPRRAGA